MLIFFKLSKDFANYISMFHKYCALEPRNSRNLLEICLQTVQIGLPGGVLRRNSQRNFEILLRNLRNCKFQIRFYSRGDEFLEKFNLFIHFQRKLKKNTFYARNSRKFPRKPRPFFQSRMIF